MLEGLLRGRDAKRNVIEPWESPRVPNPVREKGHGSGRCAALRQWSTITKCYLHLRGGQWRHKHPGNRAVGAVSPYQELALPFRAISSAQKPAVRPLAEAAGRDLFRKNVRTRRCGSITQVVIKCYPGINCEGFIEIKMDMFAGRRVELELVNRSAYGIEQLRPGFQGFWSYTSAAGLRLALRSPVKQCDGDVLPGEQLCRERSGRTCSND